MSSSDEIQILLKAQNLTQAAFTAARKDLAALSGESSKLTETGGRLNSLFGGMRSQVTATAAGFLTANAVLGVVGTSFHALTEFVSSSVEAYSAQELAVKRMTTALQAQGTATPTVIGQFVKMASGFQNTTVYADELINEMQALLVQVGNVMPSQMEGALKASTDLASGLGIDLRTATLLVGKAFAGETGTLARYGIVLDEAKLKAHGATAVLDAIQSKFGGQAAAEVDTYSGRVKQLANAWDEVKEAVGKGIVQNPLLVAAMRLVTEETKKQSDAGRDSSDELARRLRVFGPLGLAYLRLAEYAKAANTEASNLARVIANAPKLPNFASTQLPQFGRDLSDATRLLEEEKVALDHAKAAAKEHADAVKKLIEGYSGKAAIADAKTAIEAVTAAHRQGITIEKMQVDQVEALDKTLSAAIEVYRLLGRDAPANLRKIYDETHRVVTIAEDAKVAMEDWNDSVKRHLEEQKQAEQETLDALEKIDQERFDAAKAQLDDYAEVVKKHQEDQRAGEEATLAALKKRSQDSKQALHDIADALDRLAESSGGAFGSIVSGVSNAVHAWQAGKAAAEAYAAATTNAQKTAAALQGAAAVAQGTGQGSTGSRVLGGASAGAAIGSMPALAVATGGWSIAIGAAAGALVGLYRGLKGLTDYQKSMRAAAVETENLHAQLIKSHRTMNDLIIDASLVGINIKEAFNWHDPEAFKTVVEDLDAKTQLLSSAMEEYGFTWEDLGEKARGAKLGQLFDDLFAKTDILRTAGIDYHTILERQADDYSKLVQAAIRTGTEIPAAMQQTLQDLVDMGKLVDENGVAFTDLADVQWSKTLTQGFDQVTQAIKDLTEALVHGVGGALDQLGSRTVRIPIKYDVEDAPESQQQGYAGGSHGEYVSAGIGRSVRLHGREAIVPRSGVSSLAKDIAAEMPQPRFTQNKPAESWGTLQVVLPIGRQVERYTIDLDKERRRQGQPTERRTLTEQSF